jgi:hypothetical protein
MQATRKRVGRLASTLKKGRLPNDRFSKPEAEAERLGRTECDLDDWQASRCLSLADYRRKEGLAKQAASASAVRQLVFEPSKDYCTSELRGTIIYCHISITYGNHY